MRHGKTVNHLGRTASHRKAMLANMATSLILHKRIKTTTAKAKALRKYIEPLLTKAKNDTTHSRRVVFSYLKNKESISELFNNIAQKIADRPGGYTRVLKTMNRKGDNAEMAIIELVDYNENLLKTSGKTAKRTRRGKKVSSKPDAATIQNEVVESPSTDVTENKEENN
ncbi:MAG: 50S ribosomal protein L17 [Bacteroidia bacterium]